MLPDVLLDSAHDRESFIAFALTLAEERDRSEQFLRDKPDTHIVDGALGWMNGSIGQFIGAGLTHLEPAPGEEPIETLTWKDLAMFLYCGKIIEKQPNKPFHTRGRPLLFFQSCRFSWPPRR
jgi:hypothetical protein